MGLERRIPKPKGGSSSLPCPTKRFQWLCGVKEVSPPSQGGDAGALPARAAISTLELMAATNRFEGDYFV